LDADYILTEDLIQEIANLNPDCTTSAYWSDFDYCIQGKRLRGSLYPARRVLYRRCRAHYEQDGHAHRVVIAGRSDRLAGVILHDDRKSLSTWVTSQTGYMAREVEKLFSRSTSELTIADRVRKLHFVAPFAVFFYCLFIKRGILDGRAGLFYAFQRMTAELLLSLYLIENSIIGRNTKRKSVREQETGALLPIENRK
jgi:hypothetical protein